MARLNYVIQFLNGNLSTNRGSARITVNSNYAGNRFARIYLDGGVVPGYVNISGTNTLLVDNLDPGVYVVQYQDDNGQKTLAKVKVTDYDDTCWNYTEDNYVETGSFGTFGVQDAKVLLQFSVSFSNIDGIFVDRSMRFSIDGGATYKDPNGSGIAEWTNSEMAALGISGTIPDLRIKRVSNSCENANAEDLFLETVVIPPLEVSYTKTDVTATGADDGTITLILSGGSGSFSFLWSDGSVVQNRSGLAPGFYNVQVTDNTTAQVVNVNNIQITEPQAPPTEGSLLEVALLNSIKFVVDPIETPGPCSGMATPDNQLFRDQRYPGFTESNYFQKIAKCDAPIVQFNSDYGNHTLELRDYCTDEVIKTLFPELKEDNIGRTEDFQLILTNHSVVGQTRVYFAVGPIPIPLSVGTPFEILNNADGFNGNYLIVDILTDQSVGYQYLVITKNYGIAAPTSAATGRFSTAPVNFNVYECVVPMIDVPDGEYYLHLKAFDNDDNFKVAVSEPLDIQVDHPDTVLITYRNIDNSFDMTWQTGYIGAIRIEAIVGPVRIPGGERTLSRNSDYSLEKVAAKKTRVFQMFTYMLPEWLHEKLSVVFDTDIWTVNGVRYQSSEAYADPTYLQQFRLSNSSIKIEQFGWMDRFNSDDIGTVADEGKLMHETGFLLR
jgi:hypothetical protein